MIAEDSGAIMLMDYRPGTAGKLVCKTTWIFFETVRHLGLPYPSFQDEGI